MPNLNSNSMNCWMECSTPEERASSLPIICMLSGRMIGGLIGSTLTSAVGSFASLLSFLSTTSTSASEASFPGKLLVYLWALTAHLYWPICHFLHTLEFDFMLTTMKQYSIATLFDTLTIYSTLKMGSLEITSAQFRQFTLRNWS